MTLLLPLSCLTLDRWEIQFLNLHTQGLQCVEAEVPITFKVNKNKRIILNFQFKPMGIKSVHWPQKRILWKMTKPSPTSEEHSNLSQKRCWTVIMGIREKRASTCLCVYIHFRFQSSSLRRDFCPVMQQWVKCNILHRKGIFKWIFLRASTAIFINVTFAVITSEWKWY